MIEYELNRHNHLIDPNLHIWGWEIPVYLFLGGLTAGVMVFSALIAMRADALDERSRVARLAPFLAPIALSIGMGALFLDLAYKLHVYRFYLAFQLGSPMSWGSWILMVVYPAVLLLGLAGLTDDDWAKLNALSLVKKLAGVGLVAKLDLVGKLDALRGWSRAHIQGLGWANIALGVSLGAYTGVLLGSLGARPLWNSGILPVLFLCSGLSGGAALMMLFPLKHGEHDALRRWDMIIIAAELVVLCLYLVTLVSGGGAVGQEAATLFLGGKYTVAFWGFVVFLGLLVPFGMEYLEGARKIKPAMAAPALLLIGGFALRWILVYGGQL
ncbi:polysulfide reductase NrfD [Myxococcota bacterium]|nr:polysulfide reductase NrfD [Myxococcota bacterium]MBU1429080.1 polysulfide reductase NrfD [Myxococcota bacterium]MBU1899868.1 polysulfide reductase NrfD [Myxococcota bacterium]